MQLDTIPDSNNRAWRQTLEKINRVTCENVRVQLQKAKKINRRDTIIWEERVYVKEAATRTHTVYVGRESPPAVAGYAPLASIPHIPSIKR